MRAVVQRVSHAQVKVDGKVVGKIEKGYLVLLGVKEGDTTKEADFLANKVVNLRVFEDENDKMNLSIKDVGGEMLIVSQFTLYGDASHGNRPSFTEAARPEEANSLYEYFCDKVGQEVHVEKGVFQAEMKVELLNDGPVTVLLEKEA
jgi:D-tyrosyl-tRNA(Tyr) deacylase